MRRRFRIVGATAVLVAFVLGSVSVPASAQSADDATPDQSEPTATTAAVNGEPSSTADDVTANEPARSPTDLEIMADPLVQFTADEFSTLLRQRESLGLTALSELEARLSVREWWPSYAEFGVVLLPGEVDSWMVRSDLEFRANAVHSYAATLPGYVSGRQTGPLSFTVFMRADGASAVRENARSQGSPVEVVELPFSRTDLRHEADSRLQALPQASRSAVWSFVLDERGITYKVDPSSSIGDVVSASLTAQGRYPSQVVFEAQPMGVTELRCPNRDRCAPRGGGLSVLRTTDGLAECTSGFTVIGVSGEQLNDRAISTAGHCGPTATAFGSNRNDGSNSPTPRTPGFAESDRVNDALMDFVALRNDTESLHAQNAYFRDAGARAHAVTATGPGFNGQAVCVSAFRALVRRCGVITDASFSGTVEGADFDDRIDIDMNDGEVGGIRGDSGGSITSAVSPNIALATVDAGANARAGTSPEQFDRLISPRVENFGAATGWAVLTSSTYFSNSRNFIIEAYDTGLLRSPDPSGFTYWNNYLATSCSTRVDDVVTHFMNTAEMTNARPLTTIDSITRRVRRLYWTAMGRDPDPGGLSYWQNEITALPLSQREARWQEIVQQFMDFPEFSQRMANGPGNGTLGIRPPC